MARRKDPDLIITIEDVTPALAIEWLEKNTHNRKVSDRLVMVYAETMSEGEWRLNGEPIIFDRLDKLQSGQHRLMACVEAGVSFRTVVVRGADPEAIYSLDAGRKRRMTDVLTLRGEKDVANLATAITWTWRWEQGLMDRGGDTATTVHLLNLLDATPELRDSLIMGRSLAQSQGVSAGLMAALFHQFARIDAEDAKQFHEHLFSGENISGTHPAFVWRRWVTRSRLQPRRPSSAYVAAVTVKAWNAYREHREIRVLSWKPEEIFPEAV